MNRRSKPRTDALPPEIGTLLEEIEKEPVPERLLELARQLQEALSERRRREEELDEPTARTSLKARQQR